MFNIYKKLEELEKKGKQIRIGIIGCGQMGRGLVVQLHKVKSMIPMIVCDHRAYKAVDAFKECGIPEEKIAICNTQSDCLVAFYQKKYIATENADVITSFPFLDVVVEATGDPNQGAKFAKASIENKKHVVMLNVEADVVVGPYLNYLANKNSVIYTGTAGDEPGAVIELYHFAKALGFEIIAMGKGKNNKVDKSCTPRTVQDEADRRKMSPHMLSSFKDGSKTMVELAAMSNATGLKPDVVGCHGIISDVKGLNQKLKLKEDGGLLNKHGVVEYVNGIAPGVFVTVKTDNEEIDYQFKYHSLGDGPLRTLYRPYHLCNLETPITIARCIIDNEPTIVSETLVSEVIACAKKDMLAGTRVDGIGGFTTYGSITTKKDAELKNYVPYGLINHNAVLLKDVKKGQILTYDDIKLDENSEIYKIRKLQDSMKL